MCQIVMEKAVAFGFLLLVSVSAHPTHQPLTNNTSGTPECSRNTDCPSGKACVEEKCVDPCDGACGSNTVCHLLDLTPMCACRPGFKGHPFTGCTADPSVECVKNDQCSADKACLQLICVDPCLGACGLNTECMTINHHPKCTCISGFHFYPFIGCVRLELPQCQTNAQCPEERACVGQKCVDPCVGVCANNTVCHVTNHYPACACSPGFTGDAFVECKPLSPPSLETNKTTSRTFKTGLKKKFVLVNESLTWAKALLYCQSKDMALAAIENAEEQREVERITAHVENEFMHLSGWSDERNPDQFMWMTTGKLIQYSNWVSGEPNGAECHCLKLLPHSWSSKWMSDRCSYERKFVCQFYEN